MAALIVRLLCFGQQYQALKTRVKNNSNQGSLLKKEDKHTIHEATRNKHEVRSRDFVKLREISWIVPSSSFFKSPRETDCDCNCLFLSNLASSRACGPTKRLRPAKAAGRK